MKNKKNLKIIVAAVVIIIVLLIIFVSVKVSTANVPVETEEHYAELPEIRISDYIESENAPSATNSPDPYETERF